MNLLGKIPKSVYLCCSGGVDSMTMLFKLLKMRRDVTVLYFNHNTQHGKEAEHFLHEFCRERNLVLHIGAYYGTEKTEEAWRNARYKFFSFFKDKPILTAHTLCDNIETYIMSDIKGTAKFIPYQRDNIIRPMLLLSKNKILEYASENKVVWIEDPSNSTSNYDRNKIRNQVIPVLKQINPGLERVFKRRCIEKYRKDGLKI